MGWEKSNEDNQRKRDFARILVDSNIRKTSTYPPAGRRFRIVFGMVICGFFGTIYGFSTFFANKNALHDVPFFIPPFGDVGNIISCLIFGILIGCIAGWSDDFVRSVSRTAIIGGIFVMAHIMIRNLSVVFVFGPLQIVGALVLSSVVIGIAYLFAWMIRIAIEVNSENWRDPWWSWRRIRYLILLVAIFVGLGILGMYQENAVSNLRYVDRSIRMSILNQRPMSLDCQTCGDLFSGNINNDLNGYRLIWSHRWIEMDGLPSYFEVAGMVMVVFDRGDSMICLISTSTHAPFCERTQSRPIYELLTLTPLSV